jgi:hypothetical protein
MKSCEGLEAVEGIWRSVEGVWDPFTRVLGTTSSQKKGIFHSSLGLGSCPAAPGSADGLPCLWAATGWQHSPKYLDCTQRGIWSGNSLGRVPNTDLRKH